MAIHVKNKSASAPQKVQTVQLFERSARMPIHDEFTAIHVKNKSALAPQKVQTNQLFRKGVRQPKLSKLLELSSYYQRYAELKVCEIRSLNQNFALSLR